MFNVGKEIYQFKLNLDRTLKRLYVMFELTEEEQDILTKHSDGWSLRQIAKSYHRCHQYIDWKLKKLKEKVNRRWEMAEKENNYLNKKE